MCSDILSNFEHQVDVSPDALAVIDNDKQFTYAELDFLASTLASTLQRLDVNSSSRICVAVKQSVTSVALHLALQRLKAICIPIDYRVEVEILDMIINETDPQYLIIDTALTLRSCDSLVSLVTLDDLARLNESNNAIYQHPDASLSNSARVSYIFYTSGSESTPKGVVVGWKALGLFIDRAIERMGIYADDRMFQYSNAGFISSVGQIYTALSAGACLVLHDFEWSYERLVIELVDKEVTILWVTTFVAAELLIYDSLMRQLSRSLRLLRVGGEPLTRKLATDWLTLTGVPILNSYGPTEAVQDVCSKFISDVASEITVGHALPGVEVALCDDDGVFSKNLVIGQIAVISDALSYGYHGDDRLTRERFIFSDVGSRVYLTGDRAERLSNGEFKFLGRISERLFYFSKSVDSGMVIESLEALDGVSQVFCVGDSTHDNGAVFFYIGRRSSTLDRKIAAIRGRHSLPPSVRFVRLESAPLTRNGKLDRNHLARLAGYSLYG